ncbi:AmmeMemoRadiSam system protein B [bacterium]|nr:AmmeMemoRadiSam system protein B [bacterium]MBU1957689.1 AmmeMemoRadiSam system protein B [bacterium]
MSNRLMSVAGTFYPNHCQAIEAYIQEFDKIQDTSPKLKFRPKAIISPHAGYIYSGFTANCAYKLIDASHFKRVVVIGPSHRVYLKGASVALYDRYETPCGSLAVDVEYSKALMEQYDFLSFSPEVHQEHSTETQMPFVQRYFPEVNVVEIVYGDMNYKSLIPLMKSLLDDPETFLVISTDLSHFYDLKDANSLDSICLKGIETLDVHLLNQGCEACGMIGVKALLEVATKSQLIDYRTSYDASHDDTRVVGYLSALLA